MGRHELAGDDVGPEGSPVSPFSLTEAEAEQVMHELVVAWRKGVVDGVIIGWLVGLLVLLVIFT